MKSVVRLIIILAQRAKCSIEFPIRRKEKSTSKGNNLLPLILGSSYVISRFFPSQLIANINNVIEIKILEKLILAETKPGINPSPISMSVKVARAKNKASCNSL